MQPTLSAFARALTKNKSARVELDTGTPRTDGVRIYYRPPIQLGLDYKHDRTVCDRRDEEGLLKCGACRVRENVLVVIYHEISHMVYDSFASTSDEEKREVITAAIKEAGGKRAEAIARHIESAPYWIKNSYIGMAGLVSEFLPMLVNALEDARVNREMFRSRPGTRVMMRAHSRQIFTEGVEQQDRSILKWSDYPPNSQILVGIYCKASGYDYDSWFHPAVVEALHDDELTMLVNRMENIRNVSGVYHLSFPVLERIRALGFCKLPEDPEPEPSEETGDDDELGQPSPQDDVQGDEGSDEQQDAEESSDSDEAEGSDSSGNSGGDSAPEDDAEGEGDSSDSGDDDSSTGDTEDDSESVSDGGASPESDDDDRDGDDTGSDSDEDQGPADGDPTSGDPDAGDADSPEQGATGDSDDLDSSSPGDTGTPDDGDVDGEASPSSGDSDPQAGDDTSDRSEAGEPGSTEQGDGDLHSEDESPSEGDDVSPGSDDDGERDSDEEFDGDVVGTPSTDRGEGSVEPSADGTPSGDTGEPTEDASDDDGTGADPYDPTTDPRLRDLEDGEVIDTGADEGEGGTGVREIEPLPQDPEDMGSPQEAEKALKVFGDHVDKPKTIDQMAEEEAIVRAIIQGLYFEKPSENVTGVRVHRYETRPEDAEGWAHKWWSGYAGRDRTSLGIDCDMEVPESALGPALLRMRVAFADNQRGQHQKHLRSGRIRANVLGRRAWSDDERLFQKKILPGKKDYFVCIGIDISGSTMGVNIGLAKRAAKAQAELLHRMGIKFAIYAHSAIRSGGSWNSGLSLEIYEIKSENEPWSQPIQARLEELGPVADNLDGHSIEFYRKRCDESNATHKIIMYYTDGKMPAANHDEELEVLQREIQTCKTRGYTLMGVGIRTDSPIRHGLDTVQVDDDDDLASVVRHLEKRLSVS